MDPKPDLEAPAPGTRCEKCGDVADGVKDYCATCADNTPPMTLRAFLAYAADSTVNGSSR